MGSGVPAQQVGIEWKTQLTIHDHRLRVLPLNQAHIEQGIVGQQQVPIPTRMASWAA